MPPKYGDYEDLIRDLDAEGMSDDPFSGEFDDDDLALLGALNPETPRRRKAPAVAPKKTTKRKAK